MAHRRAEQPVLLHYNMYMSEVRTIHRESKVFAFPEQFQLQQHHRQQPSHGASARGSGGRIECTETQDHDSSEEEGEDAVETTTVPPLNAIAVTLKNLYTIYGWMDCVYTNRYTSSFYERGELGSKTGF